MKKIYILLFSLIIIVVMIWNALDTPGIKDLQGDFKEVVFIRNEQNTGPVVRLYAVTMNDGGQQEMEQYGNYMPHTKYGTTLVYFFSSKAPYPEALNLSDPHIPEKFRKYCIGVYEKDGMGQVSVRERPYP
jgi:hypothetical protein